MKIFKKKFTKTVDKWIKAWYNKYINKRKKELKMANTIVKVVDVTSYELDTLRYFDAWAGGLDTLEEAKLNGQIEELDQLCEMVFEGCEVDETTINDWLWFDEEVNAMVYGE